MTSRRTFLAALGAAFALDPERLLWVPGAKTISVPAPRVIQHAYDEETGIRIELVRCYDNIAVFMRREAAAARTTIS